MSISKTERIVALKFVVVPSIEGRMNLAKIPPLRLPAQAGSG